MNSFQKLTIAADYSDTYQGDYLDYYQIHIFSFNKVFSTYLDPNSVSIDVITQTIHALCNEIATRSGNQPALFEHKRKFLITYNEDILDPVELHEFNIEYTRYDEFYDFVDLFEFLGDNRIDVFIKNALTTVGAEELCQEIEPQIKKLMTHQEHNNIFAEEIRELDKNNPKYILEIYKIEKNYVPLKQHQILSNDFNLTVYLPENRYLVKNENRFSYKVTEIATNKVIENNISEKIEGIKYNKYLKRNPPFMDLSDLQRMDLANDDPDFLSYDNYVKYDDEYEEGDDEYCPT